MRRRTSAGRGRRHRGGDALERAVLAGRGRRQRVAPGRPRAGHDDDVARRAGLDARREAGRGATGRCGGPRRGAPANGEERADARGRTGAGRHPGDHRRTSRRGARMLRSSAQGPPRHRRRSRSHLDDRSEGRRRPDVARRAPEPDHGADGGRLHIGHHSEPALREQSGGLRDEGVLSLQLPPSPHEDGPVGSPSATALIHPAAVHR